ncbi:putative hydrolase/acyltransferase (alpha/beta hydrolase superfamily) protein [Dioscorea alata]|uniref:Hydrolase/acyltransferase (Alpha/beta hydrolase superfamily) protein n=1 Tax=Dioscorea alata TaxID=55571 RepID=A0ACB7U0I1_DIOAL|nr:putative hydrolase/acyltransferase (alpha/beta hydrolase superfamily) protein [Dioscorea alata]
MAGASEHEEGGEGGGVAAVSTTSPFWKAMGFWGYLTVFVSVLALFLSSISTPSAHSWFLSLPDDLRSHYSVSKPIKTHLAPHLPPVNVFAADYGPRDSETVLLLHGLASSSFSFRHVIRSLSSRSIRAVAVDLPSAGFSDGLGHRSGGFFDWIRGVYHDIKEKGLFWGFDQMVEKGSNPFEEKPERSSAAVGSEDLGMIIGQVIESMGLAPVHLVLHDSALEAGAIWISRTPGSVRSVTLIDSAAGFPAFPWGLLGVPVLGDMVLRSKTLFAGLLRLCCSRSVERSAAEAHRLLLRKKGGKEGVLELAKGLNESFDVGEWARSEGVRSLPFLVLWSSMWSDRWIDEGRRVAQAIPMAQFSYHSGGRWPQEDAGDEIAGMIAEFVSSLPKSIRQVKEDQDLAVAVDVEVEHAHTQEKFVERSNDDNDHLYGDHQQQPQQHYVNGHMDMYGLGQGWWN